MNRQWNRIWLVRDL